MVTLESLCAANAIPIYSHTDCRLSRYGRILHGFDPGDLCTTADRTTSIDPEKNAYVASVPELERDPFVAGAAAAIFGGMDVQAGYCNGPNSKLNAMEYHKTSEVYVSVTPSLLLLGRVSDIASFRSWDSHLGEAFFFPAGTVFECYPMTLHFSPFRAERAGFKTVIILPRGTNTPLDPEAPYAIPGDRGNDPGNDPEKRLLFMKNKWLIAHPERLPLIERGAWPGIKGPNLELFPGD